MSTRTTAAANVTAASAATQRPVVMARLDFSSGVVACHTEVGSFSYNGDSYVGLGYLGGIDVIRETTAARPLDVRLRLSGIDSGLLATALTEDYHGRDAIIYVGWLDVDGALVTDPEKRWAGRMDSMRVSLEEGTGTIELTCENALADFSRSSRARATDQDQQLLYPGDTFLRFLPILGNKTVHWGGLPIRVPSTNVPGGGDDRRRNTVRFEP